MTAATPSRALSTLSPAPSNPKTPDAMATPASRLRTSENRLAAKKGLKAKVAHLLTRDRNAIRNARNKAEDLWYRAGLEPDVLEEKLVTAAMAKLAERRAARIDVSAVYSAFENYIPPIVYGKDARGDQERQELIEVQLDMSFSGRVRTQRDEESDDEELNPYLKKQEAEQDSQQLQQIPAYTPKQKAAAANRKTGYERDTGSQGRRGTAKATVPESSTMGKNGENEEYESLSDAEYESDSTSDTSESSSPDGESEDISHTPLVAVTRGQPLPKVYVAPKGPSRATLRRLKHIRFVRRNANNTLRAVTRGETVETKHDADVEKKGVVSRKRARGETEGLEGESRGVEREGKKGKRA